MRTQPANMPPISDAEPLVPEQVSNELKPETEIVILFKGGPPIVDKWDSKDYVVPPIPRHPDGRHVCSLEEWQKQSHPAAHFRVAYGVALHLRERNIVPGTRNPHNGKAVSQIAIVQTPNGKGLDPENRAQPFTDEQKKQFGWPEGLDRSMFEDSRKNVTVLSTEEAAAQAYARGVDVEEVLETEHGRDVTAPPADHEGLRELRVAEHEANAAGVQTSRTRGSKTRFKDEQ
jgi:hypothetical protein